MGAAIAEAGTEYALQAANQYTDLGILVLLFWIAAVATFVGYRIRGVKAEIDSRINKFIAENSADHEVLAGAERRNQADISKLADALQKEHTQQRSSISSLEKLATELKVGFEAQRDNTDKILHNVDKLVRDVGYIQGRSDR